MTLYLHGLGHFNPEHEITNAFLEELDIGTTDQWILERVGIRSRRTVMPLDYLRQTHNEEPRAALEVATYSNADLAVNAAEMAIARAGIETEQIGMVIAGSSATDTASPADACNIARALELEVPAFDILSACTSFYVQLYLLQQMDPQRLPDFLLLAVPDALTRTVDYRDRAAAVLWGDGAAVAIVSTRVPAPVEILGSTLSSSPAGADKVVVPRLGHFTQEGRVVQTFGIKRMTRMIRELRDRFSDEERHFHFVGHQANLRMLQNVCKQCEIPNDRHHSNVEWFGNTGAASSASVISMNWEKWEGDDDIGVAGVGAGLTWSSYLMRFEGRG
jgi:3-oxoacyl-[acyl-carrier-protein] synthase-3